MLTIRRLGLFACLGASLLLLAGCQAADESAEFEYLPLFGDGSNDTSPVVATVNGVEITQMQMEMRYDELPDPKKSKYVGPEGQRLLLKDMVDQIILAQQAVELKLYNDQAAARTLISNRRSTLDLAMRNIGILRGKGPTEDEVMDYYMENRTDYKKKGMILARHVECLSKEKAQEAYDRLMTDTWENRFPVIVKEYSVNRETAANDGDLGWFNKGGFVPHIFEAKTFTARVYDMADGVNPVFSNGGRWHVVEIQRREYDRSMTFTEAMPMVKKDIMPSFQAKLIEEHLLESRKINDVVFLGIFAPGQGLSAEELFSKARLVADLNQRLELFKLIYTDFPESDRADDALFLAGNLVLDEFMDRRAAAKLLDRLLKEYPDSELVPDTNFLLENLDNPEARNPTSIEELRK